MRQKGGAAFGSANSFLSKVAAVATLVAAFESQ